MAILISCWFTSLSSRIFWLCSRILNLCSWISFFRIYRFFFIPSFWWPCISIYRIACFWFVTGRYCSQLRNYNPWIFAWSRCRYSRWLCYDVHHNGNGHRWMDVRLDLWFDRILCRCLLEWHCVEFPKYSDCLVFDNKKPQVKNRELAGGLGSFLQRQNMI